MNVAAEVGVPWSNTKVFISHRQLTAEVAAWLEQHTKAGEHWGLKWLCKEKDEQGATPQIGYYFGFTDKNAALLFKLTWCGK